MKSVDVCTISGIFNHFWMTVLTEEPLRERIGLKYGSTMWEEYPYWYLWFQDREGVYKFEMDRLQEIENFDWQVSFNIKYYPRQSELWYDGLSKLEKNARDSRIFHTHFSFGESCCHGKQHDNQVTEAADDCSTGVPLLEYRSEIPPDFYYAGQVQIAFQAETGSALKLKTQSYWRVNLLEDYKIYDQNGLVAEVLPKNSIDRNYPGLEITDFFYRRLVDAWKIIHRYQIEVDTKWQGGGFVFATDGETLRKEKSKDIQIIIEQTELKYHNESLNMPLDEDIQSYGLTLQGKEGNR